MVKCSYCSNAEGKKELYLLCSSCSKNVHIECLMTRCVPGGLLGDNFFNLICRRCSADGCDQIMRQKLTWFSIIVLTLYNLHLRSEGVSRRRYFHYRSHICNFIDKHWNVLFDPSFKKKKSWSGTVSGTLSHFCPSFFLSGTEELKELGWWRLVHTNLLPHQIIEIRAQNQGSRKKTGKSHGTFDESVSSSSLSSIVDESSLSGFEDDNSMDVSAVESEQETSIPYSGVYASTSESTSNEQRREISRQHSQEDMRSVFPDLFTNDEHLHDMDVDIDEALPLDFRGSCSDSFRDFENFLPSEPSYNARLSRNGFSYILPDIDIPDQAEDDFSLFASEEPTCGNPVLNESVIINQNNEELDKSVERGSDETNLGAAEEIPETEPVLIQSLFEHTSAEQRIPPWKQCETKEQSRMNISPQTNCVPMSEYEELQLLSRLRQASKTRELPGFAQRLYRKLCVRQLKRKRGLPIFNLDRTFQKAGDTTCSANVWMKSDNVRNHNDLNAPILDRFCRVPKKLEDKEQKQNCSFKIRLMGLCEPVCFFSPYTQRQLKPFIRRDYETTPRWLKLLSEIEAKANKNNADWQPSQRYPIDYCYVRPQHISSVNSLCCEFFYPGVDLSETLQYPDFSCVVLYKKLVVAFAFMVPDSGFNETYISFLFTRPEWRGSGIAKFMLYHLIQTCMGKDITLHVSATNPAVILYQKFGFKIEEFILDFYDKYLPADSQECKHALFLRLSR